MGMYNQRHAAGIDAIRSVQRHRRAAPAAHPRAARRRGAIRLGDRRGARAQPAVDVEAPAGAARRRASSTPGATDATRSTAPTPTRCAPSTNGAGCSPGTGARSCSASRPTQRRTDDHGHTGQRDAHHQRGDPRPRLAREDLRVADRPDGAPQRDARRQAAADDPRAASRAAAGIATSAARTATSGASSRASSGRCCSRSGGRCSCRTARPRTSSTA